MNSDYCTLPLMGLDPMVGDLLFNRVRLEVHPELEKLATDIGDTMYGEEAVVYGRMVPLLSLLCMDTSVNELSNVASTVQTRNVMGEIGRMLRNNVAKFMDFFNVAGALVEVPHYGQTWDYPIVSYIANGSIYSIPDEEIDVKSNRPLTFRTPEMVFIDMDEGRNVQGPVPLYFAVYLKTNGWSRKNIRLRIVKSHKTERHVLRTLVHHQQESDGPVFQRSAGDLYIGACKRIGWLSEPPYNDKAYRAEKYKGFRVIAFDNFKIDCACNWHIL